MLFAEENLALAGFGFVDFAAGDFSRREFGLRHQAEGNQPQAHELHRFGFGFMAGILLVHRVETPAHHFKIFFFERRHDAGNGQLVALARRSADRDRVRS